MTNNLQKNNIDDEWMSFITNTISTMSISCETENINTTTPVKSCIDESACISSTVGKGTPLLNTELSISTKTSVLHLNQPIDIQRIFWLIPITEYWKPQECIIKKQMKIVSKSKEEYEEYAKKLETIPYYNENIIKQIDNPNARRIKFKDERKITVGMSKRDIMVCRGKVKNAFYNCFAMIFRFLLAGEFKEVHVKVFNTGKLEIPGILNNTLLDSVKRMILEYIQPHIDTPLLFVDLEREENVLINSNFNCGFYINRDKLYSILRSDKYRIEAAYDPCSYPGVKCKFYYNNDLPGEQQNGQILSADRGMKLSQLIDNKKYTEISFMIFRTGSVLIVGNCSEKSLRYVYAFIKLLLEVEYEKISVVSDEPSTKIKKPKIRKRTITVNQEYYNNTISKK